MGYDFNGYLWLIVKMDYVILRPRITSKPTVREHSFKYDGK